MARTVDYLNFKKTIESCLTISRPEGGELSGSFEPGTDCFKADILPQPENICH